MRVLAWPAFNSRGDNPYCWLLYTNIESLPGVEVEEFSPGRVLRNRYAIWHLHWPELLLNSANPLAALAKTRALLLLIDWARARGIKVVWTVHNLSAHERQHPRLEAWFWKAFVRRLDGYITFGEAGMDAARCRFPELRDLQGFVIPHGHYRGEYVDHLNSQEARTVLGIPPSAKVLLFFGQIRAYKNVPRLIDAFQRFSDPNVMLYVVGKPRTPAMEENVRKAARLDPRVRLHLSFVPKDMVQTYLRAANLIILPYHETFNSGSVLLALSFSRPVLVPLQGTFSELQTQVGKEWVRTYKGNITPVQIEEALQWVLRTPRPDRAPLEQFGWKELAQQTIDAYTAVTAGLKKRP